MRVSLQLLLSAVFVALITLLAAVLGTLAYRDAVEIIDDSGRQLLTRISVTAENRARSVFGPAKSVANVLATSSQLGKGETAERLLGLNALVTGLQQSPYITAVYAGNAEGDFLLARRVPQDAEARARFDPPDGTTYIVQSLERQDGASPFGQYFYLASDLMVLGSQARPDYADFDPRSRVWYQAAQGEDSQVSTAPYVFYTTEEVGITVARRSADGAFVIGVDFSLATLSGIMAANRVTPGANSVLLTGDGLVVALPDMKTAVKRTKSDGRTTLVQKTVYELNNPVLNEAFERFRGSESGQATIRHEGQKWIVAGQRVASPGTEKFLLLWAIPEREMLSGARALVRDAIPVFLAVLLFSVLVVLLVARIVTTPLRQLRRKAEAIRRFDFHNDISVRTLVSDIDELSQAINMTETTVRRFLEITSAVSGEKDFDQLAVRLLDEIVATTQTEAGILYLTSDDNECLVPHTGRLDHGRPLPFDMPEIPLSETDSVVVRSIVDEFAVDARATAEELEAVGLGGIAAVMDEPPRHLLAAPLFNRSGELIGVLLLLETSEMDSPLVRFTEALSGFAAVAIETRQLIQAQKELFQSFIELIAGAIDAKSPYTGGHCERVPELTKMLAAAASEADAGPYRDFTLSSDQWDAVHVAAWLHDCGKVTTPEYIVDKATKLETIYDRIHEVRMRIEVMKREAEIGHLRDVIESADSAEKRQKLGRDLRQLDDDFAFLAKCNLGGEFTSDEDIERIQSLTIKTWTRTLDDRAGISRDELQRKERAAAQPLPTLEPLLADKEEHLFDRGDADLLPADNPWGFDMAVPEKLYNRGEIHNLCIRRGTLTDEDRYKINEHIVQTIKMLEQLDFPKHMKQVPEMAGGHHERMDGTGYPKKLKGEDMSLVARMMAIADIFEALTAADRPYKSGKKLSDSLRIMRYMAKDGHIDPQLFDFFLTSGVSQAYANRFLSAEQIDVPEPAAFRP
jgi:HD-GYP domain-containing protein (c-di-GMP phosphodiesterase class II)